MSEAPAADSRSSLPTMFKESAVTAGIVLALSAALVGFRMIDIPGGVDVVSRPGAVLAATTAAFFGRLAILFLRAGRAWAVLAGSVPASLFLAIGFIYEDLRAFRPFATPEVDGMLLAYTLFLVLSSSWSAWRKSRFAVVGTMPGEGITGRLQNLLRIAGPVLLVIAFILPFLPMADRRLLDIGVLVLTYIMLGWGLNIVVGLAGLLDLGYVAFYAVGAYSYALLATHFDLGFWLCLPFAGIMAAFAGILLGFPVLRLRGDYLAIVTLGFGEMIRIILLNWYTLTKGPDGISGIPRPTFFGLPFTRYPPEGTESFHSFFGLSFASIDRIIFLYYVILALALITNFFTLRIRKLPIGRAWEALREDEIACRALGINPTNTKLTAFSIGAMFGGFAGAFFATRQGFISPESFTFIESAVILAIVVLGGMGSQIGVVFAAILLIGVPEYFRELQHYRMLAFGGAMVAIMVWRPSGLLIHRKPTIELPVTSTSASEEGTR